METSQFSLGALIQAVRGNVSSLAGETGLQLHCLVDAALPDRVIGDGARMGEVLQGLLAAAGSLSPDREVRLAVFPGRDQRPELDIVFEITPVVSRAALLDSVAEGSALFLEREVEAYRRTAQTLGGEIGLQPAQGATPAGIWFRVPVQHESGDGASHERVSPLPRPSESRFPVKILMAEDNSINQRVGKLILQRAGYAIDLVGDGNEALEAHRNHSYDLILMDCQMPTMDGFEATRRIRSISARQPVIIAVTANALVGERERCLAAGMDDYLSKPFQAEQLVSIVEKWAEESLRRF